MIKIKFICCKWLPTTGVWTHIQLITGPPLYQLRNTDTEAKLKNT